MFIKQLYTNCLAEAAYYIESDGECAIIDPLRDVDQYIQLAESRNAKIKYVFETHFHADFVSGHLDLKHKTGANIVYGPSAEAVFDFIKAVDNQCFKLGHINIKLVHTPGHTLESSCFVVITEEGDKHAVFTGDTLLIGDVGRPDLAVSSDCTKEDLAGMLYNSLYNKLLLLPEEVMVYPGHGAGSQCGKNMGPERVSTIGEQKRKNYALQFDNPKDFIQSVLEGIAIPPQYFPKNAMINKRGYKEFDVIISKAMCPLNLEAFIQKSQQALILDTRAPEIFMEGNIPGAINVSLKGSFAVWVGTLIQELNTPILLVSEKGTEKEAVTRLARVGYENVLGYLEGGFDYWLQSGKPIEITAGMCPGKFKIHSAALQVLDIRSLSEYEQGSLEGAIHLPLPQLESNITKLNPEKPYHILCKTGYRAVIAASILKKHGFEHIAVLKKGYEGIKNKSKNCACTTNATST